MNSTRGFTLVEVLVAIVLISVGAIGVARATAGMTRMLHRGDRATTASALAQDQMERLRATPCASLSNGTRNEQNVYRLEWGISHVPDRVRINLTTRYPANGVVRVDSFQTTVPCL